MSVFWLEGTGRETNAGQLHACASHAKRGPLSLKTRGVFAQLAVGELRNLVHEALADHLEVTHRPRNGATLPIEDSHAGVEHMPTDPDLEFQVADYIAKSVVRAVHPVPADLV